MKFVDPAKKRYIPPKEETAYAVQISSLKEIFTTNKDEANCDNTCKSFSFLGLLKKHENLAPDISADCSTSPPDCYEDGNNFKEKIDNFYKETAKCSNVVNMDHKNKKGKVLNQHSKLYKSKSNCKKYFFLFSTADSCFKEVALKFCNPEDSAITSQSKLNLLNQCKTWHKKNNLKKRKNFHK